MVQLCANWNEPDLQTDLDLMFEALSSGDPGPVASAFSSEIPECEDILRRMLRCDLDEPVAAAFALIWAEFGPEMTDRRMNLLRWYLTSEAETRHLLDKLALIWIAPADQPVRAPMLYAAIQTMNLTVLGMLMNRLADQPVPPDLQHGVDWALGILIEIAGIDPWLSGVIRSTFEQDPQNPAAARRQAQLGLHEGQSFASLGLARCAGHRRTSDPDRPARILLDRPFCRRAPCARFAAVWQRRSAKVPSHPCGTDGLRRRAVPLLACKD